MENDFRHFTLFILLCIIYINRASAAKNFTLNSTETYIIRYFENRKIIPVSVELNSEEQTGYVASMSAKNDWKSVTLYDFLQNKVAFRDPDTNQCFVGNLLDETLDTDRKRLLELNRGIVKGFYIPTYIIHEEVMNPEVMHSEFGPRISQFCYGLATFNVTQEIPKLLSRRRRNSAVSGKVGEKGQLTHHSYGHYGHQSNNYAHYGHETHITGAVDKDGKLQNGRVSHHEVRSESSQSYPPTGHRNGLQTQTQTMNGRSTGMSPQQIMTSPTSQRNDANTFQKQVHADGSAGQFSLQTDQESGYQLKLPFGLTAGNTYRGGIRSHGQYGVGGMQPQIYTDYQKYPDGQKIDISKIPTQTSLDGSRLPVPPSSVFPSPISTTAHRQGEDLTKLGISQTGYPRVDHFGRTIPSSGIATDQQHIPSSFLPDARGTQQIDYRGIEVDVPRGTYVSGGVQPDGRSIIGPPAHGISHMPGTLDAHRYPQISPSLDIQTGIRPPGYPISRPQAGGQVIQPQIPTISESTYVPGTSHSTYYPSDVSGGLTAPGHIPGSHTFRPGSLDSQISEKVPFHPSEGIITSPGFPTPGTTVSRYSPGSQVVGPAVGRRLGPDLIQTDYSSQHRLPQSGISEFRTPSISPGSSVQGGLIQPGIQPHRGIDTRGDMRVPSTTIDRSIPPEHIGARVPGISGLPGRGPISSITGSQIAPGPASRPDTIDTFPGYPSSPDPRIPSQYPSRLVPGISHPGQQIGDSIARQPGSFPAVNGQMISPGDRSSVDQSSLTYPRTSIRTGARGPGSPQSQPAGVILSRGGDSASSQTQIQTGSEGTAAEASAAGQYSGLGSQTQVQGGYRGNGSFSAQAQSGFTGGATQSQVQGGKQGGVSGSSATVERVGSAQSQVQIGQPSGAASSTAQGRFSRGMTQVQAQSGKTGGSAGAESQSSGLSSSQVQVNIAGGEARAQNGFQGTISASVHGGHTSGQSQTQLQGGYNSGRTYVATAQGGFDSSLGYQGAVPSPGSVPIISPQIRRPGIQPPSQPLATTIRSEIQRGISYPSPTGEILGPRISSEPSFPPGPVPITAGRQPERPQVRRPGGTQTVPSPIPGSYPGQEISSVHQPPTLSRTSPPLPQTGFDQTRPSGVYQPPTSSGIQPPVHHSGLHQTHITGVYPPSALPALQQPSHHLGADRTSASDIYPPSSLPGLPRPPHQISIDQTRVSSVQPPSPLPGLQPSMHQRDIYQPGLQVPIAYRPSSIPGLQQLGYPSHPQAQIPVQQYPTHLSKPIPPDVGSVHTQPGLGLPMPHQQRPEPSALQPSLPDHIQPAFRQVAGQMPYGGLPPIQLPSPVPASQIPGSFPSSHMPSLFPALQVPGSVPAGQYPDSFPSGLQPGQFQQSIHPSRTESGIPDISFPTGGRTPTSVQQPGYPTGPHLQPPSQVSVGVPSSVHEQIPIRPPTLDHPVLPSRKQPDQDLPTRPPGVVEPGLTDEASCCEALRNLKRRCCGRNGNGKAGSSCCSKASDVGDDFDSFEDLDEKVNGEGEKCKVVKAICYIVYKPVGKARICKPTNTNGC